MPENLKCDNCQRSIKVQPTARYKIEKDGLIPICQKCAEKIGLKRDRFHGQIQNGYYIAAKQ